MKQRLPLIITALFALWILGALMPRRDPEYAFGAFGRLPVVFNGRLQPVDSLARNSLTRIREGHRQSRTDQGVVRAAQDPLGHRMVADAHDPA